MATKKEQQIKLIEIIKEALSRDKELRDKYQVAEKFRFIRDRLQSLLEKSENDLRLIEEQEKKASRGFQEGEVDVYVYLYNAQGIDLRSWMKMIMPKVFYEYSVNRPIYLDKNQVETFIRNKQNKAQHAYLTIAMKQGDILNPESGKDPLGQPLAKIKEGSLSFERFITFNHNGHIYTLGEEGELVKKV